MTTDELVDKEMWELIKDTLRNLAGLLLIVLAVPPIFRFITWWYGVWL